MARARPRAYVVLGPDATPTRTAAGQFAVATEVAGWAAGPILGWSVVAILLILAGLEATTVRLDDRATREPTGETHGERFGSLTVTGLVVLAAGVGIVRWHVPASNVIGDVLSAMAGPDSGSSLTAIALFLGLLVVPAVLAFAAAGLLAHRRPAIRWPPAVVAVAILPLEILWMVLIAADAVVLVGIFMVVVALVAAVLGFLAFRLARREAHARGWVSEEDGESWSVDGDEHAGE